MHPKLSFIHPQYLRGTNPQVGFVLLEALVAMGFVLGAWVGAFQAYQGLALRQQQLQNQKVYIRRQADAFEVDMHRQSQIMGVKQDESSRVPCRFDVEHDITQPLAHKHRGSMEKTHSVRKNTDVDC